MGKTKRNASMVLVAKLLLGSLVLLNVGILSTEAAVRRESYPTGSGTVVEPAYMDAVTGEGWAEVLKPLAGQGWNPTDMEKQLGDYLSPSRIPQGVDYPSIKAVPMFNEMWVEGIRLNAPTMQVVDGTNTYEYAAEVKVGVETWFPFPAEENEGKTYRIGAPTVTMQSSEGSGIWLDVALQLPSGEIQTVTQGVCVPDKQYSDVYAAFGDGKPQVHEFTYIAQLQTAEPVTEPDADLVCQAGWKTMDVIDLKDPYGTPVDRVPAGVKFMTPPWVGKQGETGGRLSMEVTDPRLNHLADQWQKAPSTAGSAGEINDVAKVMEAFQQAGPWMYCRNGEMKSVVEFGNFSTGKPWRTLDLSTDGGREVLALGTLVNGGQRSDYLQETIRVRNLMRTALAAAQNDYSLELWKRGRYIPNEELSVFTSWASGNERVSGEETLYDSDIELMLGEASEWIPAKYRTRAVTNDVADAEWIWVRDPDTRQILGRYAYACFDASGCLDANFVARNEWVANEDTRSITNRMRHSVREVPMKLLPETSDASMFKRLRKGWKGFDNLQMLVKLTDGIPNDGTGRGSSVRWQNERYEYGPGLAGNKVSELNCYSLNAYRGGRYDRGTGKWTQPQFISPETGQGAAEALAQFANIKVDRAVFQKQMEDFVSVDPVPNGTDYPSVKNVPMINEVIVKDLMLNTPRKHESWDGAWYEYTGEVTVQIEFWYPFPSEDNKSMEKFKMEAPSLSIGTKRDSSKDIQLLVGMTGGDSGQNYSVFSECTPEEYAKDVEAKWNGGKPYGVSFKYDIRFENVAGENITDGNLKLLWRGGWRVGTDGLLLKLGGSVVDKMASGVQCDVNPMMIEQKQRSGAFSMEVFDPRWNHLLTQWSRPDTNDEGTYGELNSLLNNRSSDQIDDGLLMYCRNGPLESPADIGFFPADKAWKTLDLMTDDGAEFLASTTCNTNLYETIKNGEKAFYTNATFNINSRNTNAVASIFYDMNCMAIPNTEPFLLWSWSDPKHGAYQDNWVTEDLARGLAKYIVEYTQQNPCMAGTDWGKATQVRNYLKEQGLDKHQREAFIRNTWGCFGVADNLFTVVVVAQSVQEGEGNVGVWDKEDQITGERRCVALVWRDPFRNGDSRENEMCVRAFRSLSVNDGRAMGNTRTSREVAGGSSNDGTDFHVETGKVEAFTRSQKDVEAGSVMVRVPGGTNTGKDPDFGPYSLTTGPFWMDQTELTLAQWRSVYEWAVSRGYEFDHEGSGKGDDHPVHTVSWFDCVKWCNARSELEGRSPVYTVEGKVYRRGQTIPDENLERSGYRLPTDDEWEYAARGGVRSYSQLRTYMNHEKANYFASPWHSEDRNSVAGYHPDYNDGIIPYTALGGSFPANGYNLYDMAGNVREWTDNATKGHWSCRGGGWDDNSSDCRFGLSYWVSPSHASYDIGFRTVCATGFTMNTPVAVPFAWLEGYAEGLAAHGGDHEAFAADTAANGRPVWECYVADLDPMGAESELRVGLAQDESGAWVPVIVSGESAARHYDFEGAEQLSSEEDVEAVWGEVGEGSRFFRVRVELTE